MKNFLQEYDIDDTALYEWLPWGALIHPAIIKNKDEFLMGFFLYDGYDGSPITLRYEGEPMRFADGWVIWNEQQNFQQSLKNVLCILWNPFFDFDGKAKNTLNGKKIKRTELKSHFYSVLLTIKQNLQKSMDIAILQGEDVLSHLTSTISMRRETVEMPQLPLYLDALLCRDIKFEMLSNQLKCNDKSLAIVSAPLSAYQAEKVDALLRVLQAYEYRFCRRILIFGQETAEKEMQKLMNGWCKNRKVMKDYLKQGMLHNINGYYTNTFIFFGEGDTLKANMAEVKRIFESVGIPYIVENENYKEIWWASLPGLFRANCTMPIQGTVGLQNFLLQGKGEAYVQVGQV